MAAFSTVLVQMGNNVGIEVPEDVVLSFDAGRRVPVTVGLNGHTYASTIARMGGRYLVPVSKAVRQAAGVAGGEEHVRSVCEAKAPETRARRVQKVVDSLLA